LAPRRLLAQVSQRWLTPERSVHVPASLRVVGVGGATLGGSSRTPVAIALARALSGLGHRVVVLGHGYGGNTRVSRRVLPEDPASLVGDEARLMTAKLPRLSIVVAPTRQAGLDYIARTSLGDVVVVDGLLQVRPKRIACSVLALHEDAPWGAGACIPEGDLRAPIERLLAASDCVVLVRSAFPRPALAAASSSLAMGGDFGSSANTFAAREQLTVPEHGAPFGLLLGVARHRRVVRALVALGIHPVCVVAAGDHQSARALTYAQKVGLRAGVRTWLMTEKCLAGLPSVAQAALLLGAEIRAIGHDLEPEDRLVQEVAKRLNES
jgi:tetraacyldisaccharide 4'-kinase